MTAGFSVEEVVSDWDNNTLWRWKANNGLGLQASAIESSRKKAETKAQEWLTRLADARIDVDYGYAPVQVVTKVAGDDPRFPRRIDVDDNRILIWEHSGNFARFDGRKRLRKAQERLWDLAVHSK